MNGKLGPYSINSIVRDDCLNVLLHLPSECIDLIYIDPPFFSQASYKLTNGKEAFIDKWASLEDYLDWLMERIIAMRQVLKETASIYVHLDWHSSHYVKVEMDKIFGYKNFQNEIIWAYSTGGVSRNRFGRKHDTLLFYSKGPTWTFNPIFRPYSKGTIERGLTGAKRDKYKLHDEGAIENDWWVLQPILSPTAFERTGYPTQKPEILLERIIKASSNENDIVGDFLCGSGTTLAVAERLRRNWFGCDTNPEAVKISLERIEKERMQYPLF